MRMFLSAALLAASIAAPAIAQEASQAETAIEVREGLTLRDSNQSRLGKITRVYDDGSVQIIIGSHFAVIPASTLEVTDDGVQTSLTKTEVRKLR